MNCNDKDIIDQHKEIRSISSKRKTSFAYQIGAGIGYKITKNIILDIAYRLENIGNSNYITYAALVIDKRDLIKLHPFNTNYLKQSVILGLRIKF